MAVTEAAAEAVADVAEEVAAEAHLVAEVGLKLSSRERVLIFGVVPAGIIGGFVIGGLYINRRMRLEYEKLAESEIQEMREHFQARLRVREEKPDLAAKAKEISEREGYSSPQTPLLEESEDEVDEESEVEETVVVEEDEVEETEEEAPAVVTNIFETTEKEADDDWDYEEEHKLRRPDRPYVIHYDERTEKDHTEATLVYYAADDVLCDERDTPVDDKEKVVGEGNLEKFGHGSNDKNVVYIRNDVMKLDVEIVKNDGSYAEVVHGFRHSEPDHRRGHPRFDDEPGSS